ncbi:unnamed protein product [Toxocara canis]|uniref:Uncharacterized protein n=1 Tax=Toxocara canis TaxID=6265 RepID=A0A183UXQ2_TOXCA|nr:unnamed protein product [Toxocara canis]
MTAAQRDHEHDSFVHCGAHTKQLARERQMEHALRQSSSTASSTPIWYPKMSGVGRAKVNVDLEDPVCIPDSSTAQRCKRERERNKSGCWSNDELAVRHAVRVNNQRERAWTSDSGVRMLKTQLHQAAEAAATAVAAAAAAAAAAATTTASAAEASAATRRAKHALRPAATQLAAHRWCFVYTDRNAFVVVERKYQLSAAESQLSEREKNGRG